MRELRRFRSAFVGCTVLVVLASCGGSRVARGVHAQAREALGGPADVTVPTTVAPSEVSEPDPSESPTTTASTTSTATSTTASSTSSAPPTTEPVPPGASGVRGRVTAGPTCPVERIDEPCPPRPVSAEVDAIDASGHTAATTQSTADGDYEMTLDPGAYTVVVVTSGWPICRPTPVTVEPGSVAVADVGCDTGIR